MEFLEFKTMILQYAEDENIDSGKIEELIVDFFKRKAIPNLESIQKFVVRCSINNPGEVFKNTSRCSYNPNPKSIGLQRCNYPKQQVFYCSMYSDTDLAFSSLTCIVETAWEHIEDLTTMRTYCTLSRWQCKRPLQLWVLPFSELSCEKNRDFKKIRMNMTNILDKHIGSKEIIQSLEFMSDVFCERKNKRLYHRISSSFYNALCVFEKYKNRRPYVSFSKYRRRRTKSCFKKRINRQ